MNKYTAAAVGVVLSLGLVTGCGSSGDAGSAGGATATATPKAGDGKATAKPGASGSAGPDAGKPATPVYAGPAIPGLAAKPAWSLPRADAIDLGDTLLFVKDEKGAYTLAAGGDDDPVDGSTGSLDTAGDDGPTTLEFRDVRTGEVRKSLKVKAESVSRVTWRDGVPAVAVFTTATTESDGLSAEKSSTLVTVYGGDGAELGKVTHEGDKFSIREGHVIEQDGQESLKLTPIGGGAARKVTCTGQLASCSFDPRSNQIDGGQAHAPLITGNYVFHVENASTYEADPEQLVMTDLTTGKKVWSTAGLALPPGVKVDEKGKRSSGAVRVLDVRDGRILTAWGAGALALDTWVTATYDIATGKQIGGSLKYTYEDTPYDTVDTEGSSVFTPDRALAAARTEGGTAVWRPADGKEVWKQEEGEKKLEPLRFSPNGVLYGSTEGETSGKTYLAVDGRTKKVLAKSLPEKNVPFFSEPSGYGRISTEKGFFVFAPQG